MPDDAMQKLQLRSGDLSWRESKGEIIILDQRRWLYLSLNGSAALLWTALAQSASRFELAEALRAEYGLDEERALADTDDFLAMLAEHELLEP